MLNGSCKVVAKVAHFVFTTYYSKDNNFYTWPWIDIILKSSYTQENYVFGHWSYVAVLCFLITRLLLLCFVYFFCN